jgi:hypothetical protein
VRRKEMHFVYWWERDHYENQDISGWIILRRIMER